MMDYAAHAKNYGLTISGTVSADVKAVVERSRGVAARHEQRRRVPDEEEQGRRHLGRGKADQAERDRGRQAHQAGDAAAGPAPKGAKGEGTYTAKHIIIATGARPRALPGIEPDGKLIWTYFEAMVPPEMPKSLLVMGSGAIGIEFASFYRSMGVDVTVVEIMPQMMPVEDAEISSWRKSSSRSTA